MVNLCAANVDEMELIDRVTISALFACVLITEFLHRTKLYCLVLQFDCSTGDSTSLPFTLIGKEGLDLRPIIELKNFQTSAEESVAVSDSQYIFHDDFLAMSITFFEMASSLL